jgi:hypothetical protein
MLMMSCPCKFETCMFVDVFVFEVSVIQKLIVVLLFSFSMKCITLPSMDLQIG